MYYNNSTYSSDSFDSIGSSKSSDSSDNSEIMTFVTKKIHHKHVDYKKSQQLSHTKNSQRKVL